MMILVTGAGGFLGKKVVALLTENKREVIRLYHGPNLVIGEERWEADLTNRDHILGLLQTSQTPDAIIHLAGRVEISLRSNPLSPFMPPLPGPENIHAMYLTNIITTANILDYALQKNIKHIIYASSQTVYGFPSERILTEDSPCIPLEHYGASKLCGEQILRIGVRQGIAVTALRFPGLYSEERTSGVVHNFCASAVGKGYIQVKADLPLPLDIIHVDDVSHAIEKSLNCIGNRWSCLNIATGEPCSLDLLADSIAELVPGCTVEHLAVSQPIVCMDSSRAYALLGWRATPRRERLAKIVEAMRTNF